MARTLGWWSVLWALLPAVTNRGRIDLGLVVEWLCEDQGIEAAATSLPSSRAPKRPKTAAA